jgi:hypothetical protein
MQAGLDITNLGAKVSAKENAVLSAGRDITFDTIQEKTVDTKMSHEKSSSGRTTDLLVLELGKSDSKSEYTRTTTTEIKNIGSELNAEGNLIMNAGRDIVVGGSDIKAKGDALIKAGRDQKFLAREDLNKTETYTQTTETHTDNSLLSQSSETKTVTIQRTEEKGTAKVSTIQVDGNLVRIAGNELYDEGTQIDVSGDYLQKAKKITNLEAKDRNEVHETKVEETKKTEQKIGLESDGLNLTVNLSELYKRNDSTEKTTTQTDEVSTTAKTSKIKVKGNMASISEEETKLRGTEIEAEGSVLLKAKNLDYEAAEDTYSKSQTTTTEKTENTFTLGLKDRGAEGKAGAKANANAESSAEAGLGTTGAKATAGANSEAGASGKAGVEFAKNEYTYTKETVDTQETSTKAKAGRVKAGKDIGIITEEKTTLVGTDIEANESVLIKAKELDYKAAEDKYSKTQTTSREEIKNTTSIGLFAQGEAKASAKADSKAKAGAGSTYAKANAEAKAEAEGRVDVFENEYEKTTTTENTKETEVKKKVGNLKAGKDIDIITTGGDATFEGTNIEAGRDITLDIKGDLNYLAAVDSKTSEKTTSEANLKNTTSLGLTGNADASAKADTSGTAKAEANAGASLTLKNELETSKSNTSESEKTTTANVGSIKAGGDVNLKAKKATFEGTQMEGGGSFIADVEEFDYKAAYDTYEKTSGSTTDTVNVDVELGLKAKAGASTKGGGEAGLGLTGSVGGGYKSEKTSESEKSSTSKVGTMKFGKDIELKSKKDVIFEGTEITAGGGADISSSEGSVKFNAARDTYERTSEKTSGEISGKVSGDLMIFGSGSELEGEAKGGYESSKESEKMSLAKAGSITAGKGGVKVTAKKDIKMEGTNVETEGSASFEAKEGEFKHEAAKSTYEASSISGSAKGQIKGKTDGEFSASAETEFKSHTVESTLSEAGKIKAKEDVLVKAGKDATFEGSEVEAGGDIDVKAKDNVNVLAATDTYKETGIELSASFGYSKEGGDDNSSTGKQGQGSSNQKTDGKSQNSKPSGQNESKEKSKSGTQKAEGKSTNATGNAADNKGSAGNADEDGGSFSGGLKADISMSDKKTQKGATFKSGGNTNIDSDKSIVMEGTKIESGKEVNLSAKDNVEFKATENKDFSFGFKGDVSGEDKNIDVNNLSGNINYQTSHEGAIIKGSIVNLNSGGKVVKEGAEIEGKTNINAAKGIEDKKVVDFGISLSTPSAKVDAQAQAGAEADTEKGSKAGAETKADAEAEGKMGGKLKIGETGIGGEVGGKAKAEAGAKADTQEGSNTSAEAGAEGSAKGQVSATKDLGTKGEVSDEVLAKAGKSYESEPKEPPQEVKTTLDKVDMLIEKGKSVDDALKLLGIDKEEYLKMREEYGDKKKMIEQVNTLMKEKGYSEAKALKVLSISPEDYAKWKEQVR